MSNANNDNSVDDKTLDEYLNGNTQYSRRYRAIHADDVPSEMDRLVIGKTEGIRSAATVTPIEIAKAKHSLRFWTRIGAPVTLAASVVLVVSIVMTNGLQKDLSNEPVMEAKPTPEARATNANAPMPVRNAPRERTTTAPQASSQAPSNELDTKAVVERKKSQPAKSPPQNYDLDRISVTTQRRQSTAEDAALPVSVIQTPEPASRTAAAAAPTSPEPIATSSLTATAKAVSAPQYREAAQTVSGKLKLEESPVAAKVADKISDKTPDKFSEGSTSALNDVQKKAATTNLELNTAKQTKEQREADPAAWLEYIRRLRTSGKSSDANREWQRFSKTFPNYHVADDDIARTRN